MTFKRILMLDTLAPHREGSLLPRRAIAVAFIASHLAAASLSAQSDDASDSQGDDFYTLSPFSVQADQDVGYRASSSMAGSRLRTPLSDIGAAVTAVTKDFLEDTGATDINELLIYTVSTEGSGIGGNFSGGELSGGFLLEDDARRKPQTATRVRGLISADITRDFFQTDIPFDSYNTSRVDINRGPNSILFGLGSPSGLVDNTLIKPILGRDATSVELRYGDHGSYRGSIDYNKMLVKDRLGVRVALLHDHEKYQQKPAFSKDQRIFVAAQGKPWVTDSASTTLTAHYEAGEIDARRPMLSAPFDRMKMWFVSGQPGWNSSLPRNVNPVPRFPPAGESSELYDNPQNLFANPSFFWQWTIPFDANSQQPIISGFQGRRPGAASTPGQPQPGNLDFFGPTSEDLFSTQLRRQSLPVSVFDFRNRLISGESGHAMSDFHAANVTLEQTFFRNRLGFELAIDEQRYEDDFFSPFGIQRTNPIFLDVNTHLPDGRVNPNYGRPFLTAWESGPRQGLTKRDAKRATAYGVFDARDHMDGWLGSVMGRHTLTALYGEQETDSQDFSSRLGWVGGSAALDLNESNIANQRRNPATMIYVGPSLVGVDWEDVRLDFNIRTELPKDGDSYKVVHWDRATASFREDSFTVREAISSAFEESETIDSEAAILQSYWLNDTIITTYGWRKDTANQSATTSFPTVESGELQGSIDVDRLELTEFPAISGQNHSFSVVAKQPKFIELPGGTEFSLHYSVSENFQPIAGEVNIFGESIAPPSGDTEEYGLSFSTMEGKVWFRATRYETSIENSREGSGISGGTFNQFLNADFQTLQFWYEGINAGGAGVTQADIDAYVASIPQGVLDLVNYQVVTLPDGTQQPQFNYPVNIMADVTNFRSTGTEFEVNANATKNWRLAANAAKVEAVRAETAPYLAEYLAGRQKIWEGPLGELPKAPNNADSATVFEEANRLALNPIRNIRAQDGVSSGELREWRFNVVSNYTFASDSRLKGWGMGGAYRWQDRIILDYPQIIDPADGILKPDLENPFYGPSEDFVDLWLSYDRKIMNDAVDWKVQLNVRNVFASDDLAPIRLDNDGSYASFRMSAPRSWFITSKFDF